MCAMKTIAQAKLHLLQDTTSSSGLTNEIICVHDLDTTHDCHVHDYFAPNTVFCGEGFRRRFWIQRELFVRIVDDIETNDPWFRLTMDARNQISFISL